MAPGRGRGAPAYRSLSICAAGPALSGRRLPRAAGPAELHGADIDPAAVRCARSNVVPLGGEVHEGDLYDPLPPELRGRVRLLAVNAPYVPSAQIETMPQEARLHEPRACLDGGADGLSVQRRVAAGAPQWLAPGGHVLIETSRRQAPADGRDSPRATGWRPGCCARRSWGPRWWPAAVRLRLRRPVAGGGAVWPQRQAVCPDRCWWRGPPGWHRLRPTSPGRLVGERRVGMDSRGAGRRGRSFPAADSAPAGVSASVAGIAVDGGTDDGTCAAGGFAELLGDLGCLVLDRLCCRGDLVLDRLALPEFRRCGP